MKSRFQNMRRDYYLALAILLALGISAGLLRWQTGSGAAITSTAPKPAGAVTSGNKIAGKVESKEGKVAANSGDLTQQLMLPVRGGNTRGESNRLQQLSDYWNSRVTYPTGNFNSAWLQSAAQADRGIQRNVPAGQVTYAGSGGSPLSLDPTRWTSLGPKSSQSDGCYGCFNYGPVAGRVDAVAIDPVSPNVAYIGTVGGGVWKTTNCCTAATTWVSTVDDPIINEVGISDIRIDPNNHNTVYAGTGEHSIATFGYGSYGLLKSTDAGGSWTAKATDVFSNAYPSPPGQFPQYQSINKVTVDPRNSNNVIAGTKTGVYLSYDGANTFNTVPCLPDAHADQRHDVTGLIAHNTGSSTVLYVAIGNPGLPTSFLPGRDFNGADGIYTATLGTSGCPANWNLITRPDNGWPVGTGSGIPHNLPGGNQLGRIDMDIAPSNPNYIYAQVQNPNPQASCGGATGCELGVWRSTDAGVTWVKQSDGNALNASACGFDNNQNWYDQGIKVDPNNPDVVFVDTYDIYKSVDGGVNLYDVTCGYGGGDTIHVDQHALEFLPGSSSVLMAGNDGGVYVTRNADTITGTLPITGWHQLNDSLTTLEFYSGDTTGNFATAPNPGANGSTQDNGSHVTTWSSPASIHPQQWQLRLGGDGFYARTEPVLGLRWYQGNNNGHISVSTDGPYGPMDDITGGWLADTQSFILPYELYKYDCPSTGCTHMIVGTNRVWETVQGGIPRTSWYANSPNLTKGTLGGGSYINQLSYAVNISTTAMVGTSDGNVQVGFGLGQGTPNSATWVNVTLSNTVLPNRPINDVTFDPVNPLVGYASVGGFSQNTPLTPGHVFQLTCTAGCASASWVDKSGNLPNVPIDSILANPRFPQQVFAGSDWGVYYTNDITASAPVWYRFDNGMRNAMVWDMTIDRGFTTLSIWTRGSSAYVWPLPSAPFVTPSPSPTATACAIAFTDVHTTDYFYEPVRYLYCHGAISGYNDNTFRPFNSTTRGQMVKIIVLAYGIPNYTPPAPTFNDVPASDPFYQYVETAAYNSVVSGYNCGGPGEPCPGVYFRPGNLVTRGQLSKITVVAAHWGLINPVSAHFNDVERNSAFYTYIETAVCHGIITGYDCGGPGEPCPGLYFRPGNNATRGQIAKIAYLSLTNPASSCSVPTPTPSPVPGTCFNYGVITSTATIISGTVDIGNHCDDCLTTVQLPFTETIYDQVFSRVYLSSNGTAVFGLASPSLSTSCLPDRNLRYAVPVAQSDQCTTNCGGGTCSTCGIFTTTTGTAPNRQFIMEWRTIKYGTSTTLNYELIFNEGSTTISTVYGVMSDANGSGEEAGIEQSAQTHWTEFSCTSPLLTAGLKVDYMRAACAP